MNLVSGIGGLYGIANASVVGLVIVLAGVVLGCARWWWPVPAWLFKVEWAMATMTLLLYAEAILRLRMTSSSIGLHLYVIVMILTLGLVTSLSGVFGFGLRGFGRVAILAAVLAPLILTLVGNVES